MKNDGREEQYWRWACSCYSDMYVNSTLPRKRFSETVWLPTCHAPTWPRGPTWNYFPRYKPQSPWNDQSQKPCTIKGYLWRWLHVQPSQCIVLVKAVHDHTESQTTAQLSVSISTHQRSASRLDASMGVAILLCYTKRSIGIVSLF